MVHKNVYDLHWLSLSLGQQLIKISVSLMVNSQKRVSSVLLI